MEKNQWDQYKKTYKAVRVTDKTIDEQWELIHDRLPSQDTSHRYFRYGFVFAALLLFFTVGIVGAAQSAKLGDTLYSVKEFTTNITKPNEQQSNKVKNIQTPIQKKPTATLTPILTNEPISPTPKKSDVKGAASKSTEQNKPEKKVMPQTGQTLEEKLSPNTQSEKPNKDEKTNSDKPDNSEKPKNENAERKSTDATGNKGKNN